MKRKILSLLLLAVSVLCQAQILKPVKWEVTSSELEDGTFLLRATGSFSSPEWHIYDFSTGANATVFKVEGVENISEAEIVSEVLSGECTHPVVIEQKVAPIPGKAPVARITISWQACRGGQCISPEEEEFTIELGTATGSFEEARLEEKASQPGTVDDTQPSKSLWALILEAIAWGFVALLTPCVFPMVPMTVSFFLKQNEPSGNAGKGRGRFLAGVFGLSIVALYTLPIAIVILLTYITGGASVTADIFNFLATHWLPNILFFIVFMLFAASFFGAFEITLPSSLVNKSDAKSNKGGLVGVFFVALTLVLVSFSCTGPIVGSVLIKSTQGQFWEPIVTMLAFSIAFALPFTVLAFAPSLLKKLPKSGGWLNSVKVVLGFIEVALGFKFLSVADQTYHWGLLDREVYLAIWIVVFTLLGFYLLGKIRFALDSEVKHLSVFRLILVIIDFSFVVYMIPGMWGAPLKALSGYLPPITTQDFRLESGVPGRGAFSASETESSGEVRKYADFLELPYGIEAYFDYDQARRAALREGKPLLIDFTGHGCVNCREMESRVWSDSRVLSIMKQDYVVCALYADDKMVLPREDWVTTPEGKVLKSLGKINSWFAMTRFNVNAQPYYAILDPATEKHKVPSRGYDLDVEAFLNFLQKGLEQ